MGEIKRYFLDTNIIIYYLQGNNKVKKIFNEIEHGLAVGYFSFITKIELYSFPDIQKKEKDKITEILYYLKYTDYNKEIEEDIIKSRQKYKIKIPDLIIGYSAKNLKSILVSANEKDFKNINNLRIINPITVY